MISRNDLMDRITEVLVAADRAFEAENLESPGWGAAVHPGTVTRCAACGAWGELIPGPSCQHPPDSRVQAPSFLLTSRGGETVPVTAAVTASLALEQVWLAGRVSCAFSPGPVYTPQAPLDVLWVILYVADRISGDTAVWTQFRVRLTTGDSPRPLIIVCYERPPALPL